MNCFFIFTELLCKWGSSWYKLLVCEAQGPTNLIEKAHLSEKGPFSCVEWTLNFQNVEKWKCLMVPHLGFAYVGYCRSLAIISHIKKLPLK